MTEEQLRWGLAAALALYEGFLRGDENVEVRIMHAADLRQLADNNGAIEALDADQIRELREVVMDGRAWTEILRQAEALP